MHNHHEGRSCGHHGHHGHHHHEGFGRRGFKHGFGAGMPPHGFGGMRARRGDVRAAILRLLSEEPMHGYQIIQEFSNRSDGAWTPSAGSIYPTLQLLADEGLIVAEETGGKKVFSLTDAGVAAVAETAEEPAPWEATRGTATDSGYREATGKLMAAMFQLGKTGSADQLAAGAEILVEARKKLYAILAED